MGWTRWFTYMIAGSLYALGFASNFVEWGHLYGITLPGPTVGYALLAVAALVTLNALSTEASGKGETVITLVKIAILGVFVAFGLTAARTGEFRPLFSKGALSVLPAMGLTFIAFQGYDLIATVTEEVENPRVNIPRAIVLSVVVTVVVYLLVVFVAIGTLGAEALGGAGETAIAQAAEGFMPRFPVVGTGASLIAFGAVFSTISALNAVVIGSSRVAFAMGREGQLPARLGRFHHRYGTPLVAIAASAVLMLVAVVVVPIRVVGNLASLFSLLGFVIVNVALVRLRSQQPDLQRPFEVPFYPLTPVLGIVCNLLLGLFIDPFTWALALAWLAFGGVVYLAWSRRRERPRDEAEVTEIQAPEPIASAEEGDD
jgi:amino acid transporter